MDDKSVDETIQRHEERAQRAYCIGVWEQVQILISLALQVIVVTSILLAIAYGLSFL